MKKYSLILFAIVLTSCTSTKKPLESKPLYDVLFGSDYGGGSFQFYEIISEENEFQMLLGDEMIKSYVKKEDIKTSNFILINMGEKATGGYTINVEKIEELADKIIVTIKEIPPTGMTTSVITKPCYVIKIKSKKPIEIK
ncbi:protease complex subunit PrcB family protein [Flavobacterium sp.]|uniref:protease complex subunit PrcB family protein n=1 Tax=Flavobacterium sp. TaxID=239 RepID=UPI003750456C